MAQYSIKDLERLSGVKAHTIRIWEQRYGVLTPKRTDTNIRRYEDEELKQILNIAQMLRHGGKISKICGLSPQELAHQVDAAIQSITQTDEYYAAHVTKLLIAMIELDEQKFEKAITHLSVKYGFPATMINVILPFLGRVGVMWQTGEVNVAQEHFISNLIRQKVIVAIDGLALAPAEAERYLLFLPDGELHELGLLFSKFVLKQNGKNLLYLGQSVPLNDLLQAAEVYKPHKLMTFLTAPNTKAHLDDFMATLQNKFPNQLILIAGSQVNYYQYTSNKNLHFLHRVGDLQAYLDNALVPNS